MAGKALRLLAAGGVAACPALSSRGGAPVVDRGAANDLTVHERGTFTAVAGPDGQPVEWLPLAGSTDLCAALPQRNFQMRPGRLGAHGDTGTVFYSPRETTVS
jgi:hypothetical protein